MAIKVCFITGSRAEFDRQLWLIRDMKADKAFHVQIVVTGMHLSKTFGSTVREIEQTGFKIAARVPMRINSDRPEAIAKSVGLGTQGLAPVLQKLNPDLVVVYGDRFELLSAACAAVCMNIPIAHIAGGQVTEGAIDEQIRHMITKAAHLHCVANNVFAKRIRQMGEESWRVCTSGSPALDVIKRLALLPKQDLERDLNFSLAGKFGVVTFHPVTLDLADLKRQMTEFLKALETAHARFGLRYVITYPNADSGSAHIIRQLEGFARRNNDWVVLARHLGQKRYLSLMEYAALMIGNSSSGIVESASFRLPSVNIGDRQKGRIFPSNVIQTDYNSASILNGIRRALASRRPSVTNPYGQGNAGPKIIAFLKKTYRSKTKAQILRKKFIDV